MHCKSNSESSKKDLPCPGEKGKYSLIYQGISVRSLGIGAVQICTEASMRLTPLNSYSGGGGGGGGLDFIVHLKSC